MWHCIQCDARTYLQRRRPGHYVPQKIRVELLYLPQHAFTSAYVRAKQLIHQGHTKSEKEIRHGSDKYK